MCANRCQCWLDSTGVCSLMSVYPQLCVCQQYGYNKTSPTQHLVTLKSDVGLMGSHYAEFNFSFFCHFQNFLKIIFWLSSWFLIEVLTVHKLLYDCFYDLTIP